ncbi:hypothetical protein [Metabacillus sp. FJAT-53654]|uniref:ABC transporter permease n=1 Tax=Metabacillus rhizosphaerae TaxID=3117747 RepID=A0ABZ2MRD0_9BACI
MKEELKAILYYMFTEMKFSLMIFWSILLSSIVVLFVLADFAFRNVVISTSIATYVFCGFVGFLVTKKNLPFCIKFGATRNSFHLSASIFLLLLSIGLAIVNEIVTSIVNYTQDLLLVDGILIFEPAKLLVNTPSFGFSILFDSFIIFVVLTIGYLLGSIVYRFGQIGGFITLACVLLFNFLPFVQDAISHFFQGFLNEDMNINFVFLIIFSFILLIINWFIIKKSSPLPALSR